MSKIIFPVEATHILMFARAIGDDNPIYQDAQAAAQTPAGGIIAPPTFAAAVMHFDPAQPRPRPGTEWLGSGKKPTGLSSEPATGGGLQAGQEYIYHRQLRPGDVLSVKTRPGNMWEKESRRDGGKLVFRERITEYRDANGDLVVTAIGVGVTIEPAVAGA